MRWRISSARNSDGVGSDAGGVTGVSGWASVSGLRLPSRAWVIVSATDSVADRSGSSAINAAAASRFYGLSNKFKAFSNKDKPLVLQFTVKHEQNIDCGGGYVKLFDCSLQQDDMHGDSPYLIMFGRFCFLCKLQSEIS